MRAFDWSCVAIVCSAIAVATACGGRVDSADCGPEANYCAATDVCCPQGYECGTGYNGCPRGGCCGYAGGALKKRDAGADANPFAPAAEPGVPPPSGPSGAGSGGTPTRNPT